MSNVQAVPRPAGSSKPAREISLDLVSTTAKQLPPKMSIQAVGGWGKTSLAAQAPNPIFFMARGETGLLDLMQSGQVSNSIAHLPELLTWKEVLDAIDMLINEDHDFQTVVFDALGGFERLCHEFVCDRDFKGDWGDRGFESYMKGYSVSISDWRAFLNKLDQLREAKGMLIIFIGHVKVKPFRNPEGEDYDRYVVDVHEKTWNITHNWLGMSLFGNYLTIVDDKKRKGRGGSQRFVYTERTAAYDAKNRHGLPESISMGNSPAEAWENLMNAIREAKERNKS